MRYRGTGKKKPLGEGALEKKRSFFSQKGFFFAKQRDIGG
jgi:hypothetical protein